MEEFKNELCVLLKKYDAIIEPYQEGYGDPIVLDVYTDGREHNEEWESATHYSGIDNPKLIK